MALIMVSMERRNPESIHKKAQRLKIKCALVVCVCVCEAMHAVFYSNLDTDIVWQGSVAL